MAERGAARAILVKPDHCRGCLTCQFVCSLRACGKSNPSKAHIMIDRVKDGYGYLQSFTDDCNGCRGDYLCVQWCPYGTLQLGRS